MNTFFIIASFVGAFGSGFGLGFNVGKQNLLHKVIEQCPLKQGSVESTRKSSRLVSIACGSITPDKQCLKNNKRCLFFKQSWLLRLIVRRRPA
jgi:hypothetical protein